MPWRIWPLVLVALLAVSATVRGAPPTAVSGDFAGLIDIGDSRKLYLECKGKGSSVVILEAGLRNRGDIWTVKPDAGAAVFPEVTAFTRVCAYDRPGATLGADQFGRSDPVSMPRTIADAIADLHALLGAVAISPPYVLAGHSTGGLISRLYASTYPRGGRGSRAGGCRSGRSADCDEPRALDVYDRLLLVEPPKELAAYKDLETIDFDQSFDRMRAASKATPPHPIPFIVISKCRF
jgi:pimeloyl-ACP methyl ester carboxylesterase